MVISIEKCLSDFSDVNPSASYSKGSDDNPVILLFESPGEHEMKRAAPLVGQTGLNYEVVVAIIGLISGIEIALQFEKSSAMVVNMLNRQINNAERQKLLRHVDKLFSQKMVEDFLRITNGKRVLIAFGAISCYFAKFIVRCKSTAFSTILLCPYLGTIGMANLKFGENDLDDVKEWDEMGRLKDLKKIEVVGRFVARYQEVEGIYGWNELVNEWKERTGENVRWVGDCSEWMSR